MWVEWVVQGLLIVTCFGSSIIKAKRGQYTASAIYDAIAISIILVAMVLDHIHH